MPRVQATPAWAETLRARLRAQRLSAAKKRRDTSRRLHWQQWGHLGPIP